MYLKVEKRDKFGGQLASLRKAGFVPAELYGHGIENTHLSVALKDFRVAYKAAGENKIINLIVDGTSKPALIYEVNKNPLTDELQSIDFYQVNMNEEIHTSIPLKFIGESPAVKGLGGVLVKAMGEIKIKAFPADIPLEIVVDLTALANLNQSLYVKDLPISTKYKFEVDQSNVVVTVSEQREEEVAPVAAPAIDQVVVETEEKKAVRDAAKTAAPEAAAATKK